MTDEATNPFEAFQPDLPEEKPQPVEDIPEQVAIAKPNPFEAFKPDLPEQTGPWEAAGVHALVSAAPAIGSLPAAGAGAVLGATLGAATGPAAPIASPVLALAGGLASGFLGAGVVAKAQEWALSKLPDSWRDPLEQKLAAAEIEHPTASFIGGLVPFAMTMKPGPLAGAAAREGATALETIIANPVTGRLFGGGLMGGLELAQQKARGEEADWTDVAISTGFGVFFNKPTTIGQRLISAGERPIAGAVAKARGEGPTIAELHDLGVMGTGVTEDTASGSLEMAPAAKAEAQNGRGAEIEPPEVDIHALARRMEPETFDHYDALAKQREELRSWIDELRSPGDDAVREVAAARDAAQEALNAHLEARGGYTGGAEARRLRAELRDAQRAYDTIEERRNAFTEGRAEETEEMAAARRHLMAVDYEMRDVGREVASAYRRAAEHRGVEMVEPEIEADVSFAPEAAPDHLPPTPEGFVRFFHGGVDPTSGGGRWVTPDYAYARNFRAGSVPNEVHYVDIHETSPLLKKAFDDTGTGMKAPYQAFETSEEISKQMKPVGEMAGPGTAKAPEASAGRPLAEQRAFIADDVKRQLVAAGRSEEEARAAGQLIAARYVTRANLFKGALGTPEELYRREGAEIRGPGGAAPAGEPPVAAEAPARELVEATPQEPEPIFIGGKRVEGEFAAKLRDRIIEREAPEMVAAGPEDAGEPIFIGGQEIKGALAAQIRARMAAEPRVEEAPAPLMPTIEKPEIAAPAPAARVSEGGGIEALDPTTIDVDAERFQFKAGGDTAGVTERLQGIEKWDPRLAGTALVWRDASGKNWIADGHQRLGLAKRLSETQPGIKLSAFVLDAKEGVTDSDARVIAAVKNIAEGSGTSVDAAKIMKEAEGKDIDLPPLPPRSTLVREGQALARLSPEAFGMVVNDVVPTGQAALVGKLVADPLQQVEALRVLAKAQPDNLRQAEMIVREILATGTEEKMTQGGLFGEEAFAESVVLERARIADEALKMLKRDKSTFRTLVNEAEGIQTYGRNVLDVAANVERLTADEQASQFLSQLATRKGPVSDELTAIARRLKSEEISRAEAGREFVKIVRREIEGGLVEGADARGADAGAGGERAPVTPQGEWERLSANKQEMTEKTLPGSYNPTTSKSGAELRAKRRQEWGAGAVVDVGIVKNLLVSGRDGEGAWRLLGKPDAEGLSQEYFKSGQGPLEKGERVNFLDATKELRPEPALELFQKDGDSQFEPGAEGKPQQLIPGVEPVTDRQRAELAAGKPLKGGAAAPPEGGLFDEGARDQKELFQRDLDLAPGGGAKETKFGSAKIEYGISRDGLSAEVIRLSVPAAERGKGAARAAMNEFLAAADAEGLTVFLNSEPMGKGGLSKSALDKFYKSLGFVKNTGRNKDFSSTAEFVRPPQLSEDFFQSARGKIRFAEKKRPIITLMRDSNASTFIHETGHDWLEQLVRDSSHEMAPAGLKDDATTVLDWLGAKSVDDIKTRHHEKFARGFEQYMREGVAPSKELAGVFAKFKNWLVQIYQTIKGLGAPINDDIRGVFDRMLAEEPQGTVIAPERAREPTLIDIHETDAKLTEPDDAPAAAARIAAERARYVAEPPPEIENEIRPIVEEIEAERAATRAEEPGAKPGADAGDGAGGLGEVVRGGEEARPVTKGGGVGAGGGEEREGGIEPVAEGGAAGGRESPFRGTPLDGIAPRQRETLIGKPNRISSLENLVTELGGQVDPEVKKYLDDLLGKTDDFSDQRRGHITHGQIADWYEESGLRPEEIPEHRIGQAYNAEQMYENYRAIKTLKERIYQHGVNGDVVAYERDRALREALIKGFTGARAEAGRSVGVFRRILKEMRAAIPEGEEDKELFQLWREITGKDFKRSKTEADAVSKLQNPESVAQFLRATEERTFGRMAHEYWMSAIVSNYLSQMTDVVGNFVTLANRLTFETPAAAALGAVRGEGERVRLGEMGAGWKAIPGALAPAAKAALETLRTGEPVKLPGQQIQTSLDVYRGGGGAPLQEGAGLSDVKASTFGLLTGLSDSIRAMGAIMPDAPLLKSVPTERGMIPNVELKGAPIALGDFIRSPFNFLKSMESFSASLAYAVEKNMIAYRKAANEGLEGALFDQRVAELMRAPPVEMMEEATNAARTNALAYKGGPLSGKFAALVNSAEIAGVPVGRFIVPFVNISSIMMNEALLKRTPLGFLSKEIRADLLGANGPVAQQKAQARMIVGTSVALTTMGLAAMGKLTGSPPNDPRERAVWQAAGITPYSVKIGDSWYSYKRLGVFGLHLGIAADMVIVAQKAGEKDYSDAAGSFIHAIAKNVIDQSYFKGPSDLLRAVTEKGYGEYYVRNFLSGFVPFSSGMGQTAQLIDPVSRETRSIVDAIKAKIPGLSDDLRPRLDMWGQPVPSRDPLGPTAIWVRQQSTDPVAHEMRRLEYYPSLPERKIRGVKLTDEQYHEYARISGMMAKSNLDRYVNSPRWESIPDHVKKKTMEESVRASREAAVGLMFRRYPNILIDARNLKRAPFERGGK